MNLPLSILVLLGEAILSLIFIIWSFAFLGFSSEAHRSASLSPFGWVLNGIYLLVAFVPLVLTVWLGYRRFISSEVFPDTKTTFYFSVYWSPIFALIGAGILGLTLLMVITQNYSK